MKIRNKVNRGKKKIIKQQHSLFLLKINSLSLSTDHRDDRTGPESWPI